MALEHEIPPGERTRVFRRRFSSLPLTITLLAEPLQHGERVAGAVERSGSHWVFGRTHTTVPLLDQTRVVKGFWDTFFDIYVTPDVPVILRITKPSMRSRAVIWGLAAIVLAATTAVVALAALR